MRGSDGGSSLRWSRNISPRPASTDSCPNWSGEERCADGTPRRSTSLGRTCRKRTRWPGQRHTELPLPRPSHLGADCRCCGQHQAAGSIATDCIHRMWLFIRCRSRTYIVIAGPTGAKLSRYRSSPSSSHSVAPRYMSHFHSPKQSHAGPQTPTNLKVASGASLHSRATHCACWDLWAKRAEAPILGTFYICFEGV